MASGRSTSKRAAPPAPTGPQSKRTAVDPMHSGAGKKMFILHFEEEGPDYDSPDSEVIGIYSTKSLAIESACAALRGRTKWDVYLEEDPEDMPLEVEVAINIDGDDCPDNGAILRFKESKGECVHIYLSSTAVDQVYRPRTRGTRRVVEEPKLEERSEPMGEEGVELKDELQVETKEEMQAKVKQEVQVEIQQQGLAEVRQEVLSEMEQEREMEAKKEEKAETKQEEKAKMKVYTLRFEEGDNEHGVRWYETIGSFSTKKLAIESASLAMSDKCAPRG